MIVRRFLDWSRTAAAGDRAEAASALARAYLYSDLKPADLREAEAALILVLDDPSPLVRRSLAEAFASASSAPAAIIIALSHDQGDVAAPVLARSPLLAEADLIDCAAIGDEIAQTAIACRAGLPETVAAALSEVGSLEVVIALARNHSARLPLFAFERTIERFGASANLREALLARSDLPIRIRHDLVMAVSLALKTFVAARRWLHPERERRVFEEAGEAATLHLARADDQAMHLVPHLRETGRLTAGLILRALLSGRMPLVAAAFVELSGQPLRRVLAILDGRDMLGFEALYHRAKLPQSLFLGFKAAIEAHQEFGSQTDEAMPSTLSRLMIERVLTTLEALPSEENEKLLALLRRFDAEAAREEARRFARELLIETDVFCGAELRPTLPAAA